MATAWKLTINRGAATRTALDEAERLVTDVTRRSFNRANVLTPVDTGNLRAHNQFNVQRGSTQVVGNVFNETEYAAPVHDGHRSYVIRPRTKKALRFVVDGKVVFAKKVTIPATRGRPWIRRAVQEIAVPAGFRMGRT